MANSGDPAASARLCQLFGNEHAGGTFRRLHFRAMAKGGLGAGAYWDHYKAEADFERIEQTLSPEDASPVERVLAEASAFAYCHHHLAHARAYNMQWDHQHVKTPENERALRDQNLSAARAAHSFSRILRETDTARLRRAHIANLEARTKEIEQRIRLRESEAQQTRAESQCLHPQAEAQPETGHRPPDVDLPPDTRHLVPETRPRESSIANRESTEGSAEFPLRNPVRGASAPPPSADSQPGRTTRKPIPGESSIANRESHHDRAGTRHPIPETRSPHVYYKFPKHAKHALFKLNEPPQVLPGKGKNAPRPKPSVEQLAALR